MEGDERGHRVALVADALVNPPGGGLDALGVLEQHGWGVVQLPAEWFPEHVAGPLLEQVAEQTEEFVRHGYDVVVVGGRDGLEQALAAVGVPMPDVTAPGSVAELGAFLARRPRPAARRA